MKHLAIFILAVILCSSIKAQDTLIVYVDSLGVEEVSVSPPLYRIPIRAKGFTNVEAFDFRMFLTGDDAKIKGIEYVGAINDAFNTFGVPTADSTSFIWVLVGTQTDITVPFDTIIGYILVEADLANTSIGLTCDGLEAITGGIENVVIPSVCTTVTSLMYNPFRSVSGTVSTPEGDSVANAVVQLISDGVVLSSDTTGIDGIYVFPDIPTVGSYSVSVLKKEGADEEPRSQRIRGVNIADLVLMARDLVGSDTITDPLGALAFDVNGDGENGLVDLLSVQRYILNRTNNFGEAPFYRFYTEGEDGPLEVAVFNESTQEDLVIDFTIIKMGDVNLSSFR